MYIVFEWFAASGGLKIFFTRGDSAVSNPNYYCHPRAQQIGSICLKKVLTFKLSLTLSNLNQFSKVLHCWKAYEICYKTHLNYWPHLRRVATLPWEIKTLYFLQIFTTFVEENANKLHTKCTDFNSSRRVTVHSECIYVFLLKSCPRH